MTVKSMYYMGGKGYGGQIGRWICSLIPTNTKMYVEPFAGMLGVLLQRKISPIEWANDLDKRIFLWWKVVRDNPNELIQLLEKTPYSQSEFDRASIEIEFEKEEIRQALNITVLLWQGFLHCLSQKNNWISTINNFKDPSKRISLISKRIKNIVLFNCDCTTILEKTSKFDDILIYCDPPYFSTKTGFKYSENKMDIEKIIMLSKKQKGFMAFSGYNDEWDALGWNKRELKTKSSMSSSSLIGDINKRNERIEFLWINDMCQEILCAQDTVQDELFA